MAAACSACKYMRRKCPPNCIFAPYFPETSPSFGYVHRVYGCSNVGKILQSLPVEQRRVAAETLAFEAEARIRDPVLGCVGYIFLLQQHLGQIDRDIQEAEAKIYAAGYQPPPPPSTPPEQHWVRMPHLTTTTTVPQHHEQPDDLLLLTDAAYPSMPQAESMSEMLPISSTTPQQDDLQLMTDAEVHDFAVELEDLLGDGDIQEDETQIPSAGYQPPPPLEQHSLQMSQMTTTVPRHHEQSDDLLLLTDAAYPSPHHEQPDDLLWLTDAAYPSMPQAESMSEMFPISSMTPQQDDLQLMTDAEVHDFVAELEDLLGDGDIQEDEAQIPSAGYQPPPLLEQHSLQMPQMTTTVPPHHEQPDDLLLPTGTAYPSTPRAEPIPQLMSEMLSFSSTPPQQDDPQLMTDTEVQDFAAELEDLLS